MSDEKVCPIMSKPVALQDPHGGNYVDYPEAVCIGSRCQFWVEARTIENITWQNCAHVIGALKNSDGKIPV